MKFIRTANYKLVHHTFIANHCFSVQQNLKKIIECNDSEYLRENTVSGNSGNVALAVGLTVGLLALVAIGIVVALLLVKSEFYLLFLVVLLLKIPRLG